MESSPFNVGHLSLDGGFRRGCRAELKAREKELKRSLVAVAVPRRGGEVRKRFLPQRLGLSYMADESIRSGTITPGFGRYRPRRTSTRAELCSTTLNLRNRRRF